MKHAHQAVPGVLHQDAGKGDTQAHHRAEAQVLQSTFFHTSGGGQQAAAAAKRKGPPAQSAAAASSSATPRDRIAF